MTGVAADGMPSTLPAMEIRLGRTKTASAESDERVFIVGRPVIVLKQWIALADLRGPGPLFRAIDRFGRLATLPLDGQSINAILKKRCALAGLDPAGFSAHGLRSGYLTEAARQGVPIQEAHGAIATSLRPAGRRLFQRGRSRRGRAARLAS